MISNFTLATIMVPPTGFLVLGVILTAWDFLLLILAAALVITCLAQIAGTLSRLSTEDPLIP